jgi:hypothetical protein
LAEFFDERLCFAGGAGCVPAEFGRSDRRHFADDDVRNLARDREWRPAQQQIAQSKDEFAPD